MFWLPTMAVYIGGVVLGDTAWIWTILAGLLFFTVPHGVIVYGVNDIADRESDEQNARKGGLEGAVVSLKETRQLTYTVIIMAAFFLLLFGLTRYYLLAMAVLAIIAFSYAYSVKPIRLKTRPVFDSISNGVWVLGMFMAGYWVGVRGLSFPLPPAHIFFAVLLCPIAVHALATVLDYDVDEKANDRTIAVAFGKPATLIFCAAVFVSCYVIAGRNHFAIGAGLLLCAALCVLAAFRPTQHMVRSLAWVVMCTLPPAFVLAAIQSR